MPTLDRELTLAARRLHQHADGLPIPPLRHRGRRPVIAAAAAVVLVFAGLLAFALRDDTFTQETVGELPQQQLQTKGDHPLPDGRALLVEMTPNDDAATSAAEFCIGSDVEQLCVTANGERRVAWNITSTTDDVCPDGDSLLYGITSLPAAESLDYETSSDDGQRLAIGGVAVHPRDVPVPRSVLPGPDTASVGGMVETFATCVPAHPIGTVTLLGGYSQDLGRNVPIASDVPITPTTPVN